MVRAPIPRSVRRQAGAALATLATLAPAAAAAQPPDTLGVAACDGRPIAAIDVRSQAPALVTSTRFPLGRTVLRALFQGAVTRDAVVRSFLLARPGAICSALLLRESARVLRTQGFLATVRVDALPAAGDSVGLVVETVDEIPLVVAAAWRDGGPSALTLGNANVLGHGLSAVASWRQGTPYRDGGALRLRKHGIAGQAVIAELLGARDPLGGRLTATVTRPFLSDLQRLGWHVGYEGSTVYRGFERRDAPLAALELERRAFSTAFIGRVGGRTLRAFGGPVVTREHVRPAADGVALTDSGRVPLDDPALRDRYSAYDAARAGVALGVRFLSFATVRGFDALLAEQDVGRGVQAAAVLARGVRALGADQTDRALATDVYAGAGTARSFVGARLIGEGRRAPGRARWEDVVVSGRGAWYLKPSEQRTLVTSVEFSGVWRERLPTQFALGDRGAGVRGYRGSGLAGGRRAVLRVEARRALTGLGPRGQYGHWGVATFTDVGRTWSGDVPFGVTTVARGSVGVGLLAAVPPRSRRLLRMDLAVPVTPDAPRRVRLILSTASAARGFGRDPDDAARARAASAPAAVFGWP